MTPAQRILLRVVLIVTLTVDLSICQACEMADPLENDDFHISCYRENYTSVDIFCKGTNWANFPVVNFSYAAYVVRFGNCQVPSNLSLLNVTKSLGLQIISVLQFEKLHSGLSKMNLQGFSVRTLEIIGADFTKLPRDVLHYIDLDEISIQDARLELIPEGFFEKSTGLQNLSIDQCNLRKLRRKDFSSLKKLQTLSFYNNEIEEIEPGTFDNLEDLRLLELSFNNLRSLHPDLFKKLSRLEVINIGHNQFDDLPEDLIRSIENSRLNRFRLNGNAGNLTTLPSAFFRNLTSLNYAELIGNKFTNLPADLFWGALGLTSLNISNNSLTTLPPGIFNTTELLGELWIMNNKLQSLPDNIFLHANLHTLVLDNNRLTELAMGVVSGLTNLRILQVQNNSLRHIYHQLYKYAGNLEHIILAHNELTLEMPAIQYYSIFTNCVNIISADFSYNNISQIFRDWGYSKNLKMLNLTGNKIKHIQILEISTMSANAVIDLTGNEITTVNLSEVINEMNKYRNNNSNHPDRHAMILLGDNPFNCDCQLSEFVDFMQKKFLKRFPSVYNYIEFRGNELACSKPDRLTGKSIAEVNSNDLRCLVESNSTEGTCAKDCTCWEYSRKETLYVDCSNMNLTAIPAIIQNPKRWSIDLNMSGNLLRQTPSLNRSDLLNVTSLDLSSNNITSVGLDVFSESLHSLKLHNNSLQRLDYRVIEYIYNDDEILHNLSLHNNRWFCNCEARHLLNVVQKKLIKLQLHRVSCYETGEPMHKMTTNELCEATIIVIVAACLLVAFFGVVFGTLAALYFKYQKEIKIWLYSKQLCLWFVTEEELDKDKEYDAFISFSHKDEDFVEKELIAKLEDGPRPYKLCVHSRDWLAGEWIPTNILRSVEESRRTIVVLSPNFIESMWGKIEFRTAHSKALKEGRARVIVVLYGDIGSTEQLDPELKAYLSMNTYVKWGDPWFWDKLRYALPHRHEFAKRRTRNARLIENHLSQIPMSTESNGIGTEVVPMPKIAKNSTNDSAKLLEHGAEDERMVSAC